MKDFELDADGDLNVVGDDTTGDFAVAQTDNEDLRLLVMINKGELKAWPLCGVGVRRYVNSKELAKLVREMKLQAEADGFAQVSITGTELEDISINAERL